MMLFDICAVLAILSLGSFLIILTFAMLDEIKRHTLIKIISPALIFAVCISICIYLSSKQEIMHIQEPIKIVHYTTDKQSAEEVLEIVTESGTYRVNNLNNVEVVSDGENIASIEHPQYGLDFCEHIILTEDAAKEIGIVKLSD